MAGFGKTVPFTRQPQYPVEVNWSHPLFKNGGQVVCPTLGISQTKESGPYTPVAYSGTVDKSVTENGVVYSTTGLIQLVPAYQSLFSLLLLGTATAQQNPGSTNYYGYASLSNGTIVFGDGGAPATGNRRNYTWPSATGAIFVRPGAVITDVPTVYVRGAKQVVTYSSGTGSPYSWAGSHLVGAASNNIALLIAVPGQVDEGLMSSVSTNPWQIFQPIQRKIYAVVASGGSPYTITAVTGSFTLTGQATGLTAQRKIAANTASYGLTGNAAGLAVQRRMAAATGAFTLTGNSVTLSHATAGAYTMTAATGTFAITGSDATLIWSGSTGWRQVASASNTWADSASASSGWVDQSSASGSWTVN